MKSNIKIVFISFIIVAASPAYAQVVSLDSVLHVIDRQNPMLKEYEIKAKAQKAYSAGAKGWMAPMVGAGTFMTPYPGQDLMSETNKGSIMFSFEQSIPNPVKQNANQKYLESKASVEEQGRAVQYNSLRAEAKVQYYQWLVAEKKIKTLRESEQIVAMMVKLARVRYPYNQGSLGNIYKAEGRLSEVQNMISMTQGLIEEKQYRLKSLMNLSPDEKLMIDTSTQVKFDLNEMSVDTAVLSAQRSDVKRIERSIEVMRLNQQLQTQQSRPEFRVRFDHMQPRNAGMPLMFTAMAMVSIPIAPWSARMYKAEVQGMQYDIDAMKKGREAILIEARGMVAGMTMRLTRMEQQLSNYRIRIIPALKKNYETVMLSYEENKEELPMVIDGWEAMIMAQMDYLEKLEEYYLMIASYEKELEK